MASSRCIYDDDKNAETNARDAGTNVFSEPYNLGQGFIIGNKRRLGQKLFGLSPSSMDIKTALCAYYEVTVTSYNLYHGWHTRLVEKRLLCKISSLEQLVIVASIFYTVNLPLLSFSLKNENSRRVSKQSLANSSFIGNATVSPV